MNSLSNAETAKMWHIRLFGTLEVQCPDGTVVTFEGRKAGELLAYMALHSAKPCDKSKIVALLWKESDPTSARTRLRQDIPKLQSLLQIENGTDKAEETSLFDVTRKTVQLRPEWHTTDVQQFQESLERAAQASDPNTKLQFLNDAVRLYTADLLTEYADWVLPFRSQFRAKYEQAAHEITAIRKKLADDDSLKQLASEAKTEHPELPQIPNTPSTVRRPKSLQARRFAGVVLAVLLLFIAGRSLWRPGATEKPSPLSADTPQNSAPLLEYNKEKWVFDYVPREGEKPNSEAKAIVHNEAREFYVTGVVQTEKEDADILTVKLSSKGEQLWAKRYSNRQHECDRGLSIAIAPKGVYVAGESYLPASRGVKEGWYIVLLRYDENGEKLWEQRSPVAIRHFGWGMKVHTCADGNVVVAATGIIGKMEQTVLLSYTPQGRLRWQSAVAAKATEPNTFVDFVEPHDAGAANYGTLLVTGQTVVGEGETELDTDWMTACVELSTGKMRWVRKFDGRTHGSDSIRALQLDRYAGFYQGGTFSQSSAKTGHKAVLGIIRCTEKGDVLWRQEIPLPEKEGNRYGNFSTNSVTNSSLISMMRFIPEKQIFSEVILHDDRGVQLWKKTIEPPLGFRRLEVEHVSVIGVNNKIFVSGIIARDINLPFPDKPQIWSAYLSGDGRILRQHAFFPPPGVNRSVPITLYHCHSDMLVVGQLHRSDGSADFLVLDYASPEDP